MFRKLAAIVVMTLSLAACATYQPVDSASVMNVGGGVSVDPQIAWAKVVRPNTSGALWTVDGLGLDELYFFTDVKAGQPLITLRGEDEKETRLYADDMLPNDVMDLLASTVEKLGYRQVRTSGLAPARFGNTTGFRFNLNFSTSNGLEMKGMAIAAQRNSKLDLILFTAPAEYYFGHYSPIVDKLFSSVQTSGA